MFSCLMVISLSFKVILCVIFISFFRSWTFKPLYQSISNTRCRESTCGPSALPPPPPLSRTPSNHTPSLSLSVLVLGSMLAGGYWPRDVTAMNTPLCAMPGVLRHPGLGLVSSYDAMESRTQVPNWHTPLQTQVVSGNLTIQFNYL